jgi:hypothetical protein
LQPIPLVSDSGTAGNLVILCFASAIEFGDVLEASSPVCYIVMRVAVSV